MNKAKVLIIEDETEIREGLKLCLEEFFEIDLAENGVVGLKKAFKNSPDVILLDLKMPEMDGFQVCKALRSDPDFDSIPIMIISAFNSTADKTRLFEMGIDDYIPKPFDPDELIARIQRKLQSLVKKSTDIPTANNNNTLRVGKDLTLDLRSLEVRAGEVAISLSNTEFKILHILANRYQQLVDRESIINRVWENQPVSSRLIDPHIVSLRQKLKATHFTIQSIYGKGYILKGIS